MADESQLPVKRGPGRPPKVRAPEEAVDPRTAIAARHRFRTFIFNNLGAIERELMDLLKHAGKEDVARVNLMNKILDKLTPDQKEVVGGPTKVPTVVINNLNRGAQAVPPVRVIEGKVE